MVQIISDMHHMLTYVELTAGGEGAARAARAAQAALFVAQLEQLERSAHDGPPAASYFTTGTGAGGAVGANLAPSLISFK